MRKHDFYSNVEVIEASLLVLANYNLNDEVKEDEIGRPCSTYGEAVNSYRVLVGKPEGKKPL
jgi:hypothetical protein